MISRLLLSPTSLLRAQVFYIYETIEVIIIYKDKNLIFVAFQVLVSSFKFFING